MVNSINLTMTNKDQILTWKANRRKLVCLHDHFWWNLIWTYIAGLFHCGNARLHRSGNISTEGLRERVWLVVTWGDHVWMFGWIPAFLLWFHAWDISENRLLASLPSVPWRCSSKPGGRRLNTTVRWWITCSPAINILIFPLQVDHLRRSSTFGWSNQESFIFLWCRLGDNSPNWCSFCSTPKINHRHILFPNWWDRPSRWGEAYGDQFSKQRSRISRVSGFLWINDHWFCLIHL